MERSLRLNGLIHTRFRSINQMFERIGWNRQRGYRILSGECSPKPDELVDLAEALGVKVDDIIQHFCLRGHQLATSTNE